MLLAKDVPTLLGDCKNMDEDVAAVEAWTAIFSDKAKLVDVVTKNLLLHKRKV